MEIESIPTGWKPVMLPLNTNNSFLFKPLDGNDPSLLPYQGSVLPLSLKGRINMEPIFKFELNFTFYEKVGLPHNLNWHGAQPRVRNEF